MMTQEEIDDAKFPPMDAQNTPSLPELPEPFVMVHSDGYWTGGRGFRAPLNFCAANTWTGDQLRAYATPIAAERDRLREEVAHSHSMRLEAEADSGRAHGEAAALRTLNTELVQALLAICESTNDQLSRKLALAALAKVKP